MGTLGSLLDILAYVRHVDVAESVGLGYLLWEINAWARSPFHGWPCLCMHVRLCM